MAAARALLRHSDLGAREVATEALRIAGEIERVVVGQRALVEGLLVALLSGGHALVEGVPGLAKTTAVRIIPVPGKGPGETVEWGGLLGTAIVQEVGRFGCKRLHERGGRIPAPLQGYKN